jgi:homeobox protein cut-like
LQEQYSEAVNSIQEQKHLIGQLEEDLRSINAWSAMFRGDAEVSMLFAL